MYKLIIIILLFNLLSLYSCKTNSKSESLYISKGQSISNRKINTIQFDTVKFYAPKHRFLIPVMKIVNNSSFRNREVLSISNMIEHSINIFDFKARKLLLTIPLYNEGPNTTLYSKFIFYHMILNDSSILIMDASSKKISIVNESGIKKKGIAIPLDKDFDYIAQTGWSIQGIDFNDKFIYPIFPLAYLLKSQNDEKLNRMKHVLIYDINKDTISLNVNRKYYYSYDQIYNYDECCKANFITNYNSEMFLSDCVKPIVKIYDINTGRLSDSFLMKSNQFDQVPSYPENVSNLKNIDLGRLYEYGHTHPSYYQLHIDTLQKLIIRQTKPGMSEEEHKDNRTKWACSFILTDLNSHSYINEILIKRGQMYNIRFLDGIRTSEGLYFPFNYIQGQGDNEDYIYFVRAKFIEEK